LSSRIITKNKKAYFDYHIEETLEAGLVLTGNEIKSIRLGRVNLKDGFARIMGGELFLLNVHISPYNMADGFSHEDPERRRKLLIHRREIRRLIGKTKVKGFTLVPTKLYFKRGIVKVEVALARGKTHYDKRDSIKKKESDREMERAMKRAKAT